MTETPLQKLQRHHAVVLAYLDVQRERMDLHGVGDAAADLRVIEAEIKCAEKQLN